MISRDLRSPCPGLKGPPTGYPHPRCYAAALNDCGSKLSKEHLIAHSILKLLGKGPAPRVEGLPGKKAGEQKPLANTSFKKAMLCVRHNREGLSGLDDQGKSLYANTARINEAFSTDKAVQSESFLFHGPDIERWMLKVLCGMLVAEKATSATGTIITGWKPPEVWLQILFGRSQFPTGWVCTISRG
jgi:hypothetical protein